MYEEYSNLSEDFEPRNIPLKAAQYDNIPIPSVPEVSLISDKHVQSDQSAEHKNAEYKVLQSPSIQTYESYAAWRNNKFPPMKPLEPKSPSFATNYSPTSSKNYSPSTSKKLHHNIDSNSYSHHKSYNSPSGQSCREKLENTRDSCTSPHSLTHISRTPQSMRVPTTNTNVTFQNNQQPQNHVSPMYSERSRTPDNSSRRQKSKSKANHSCSSQMSQKPSQQIPKYYNTNSSNTIPTENHASDNQELVEHHKYPPMHSLVPPHPMYFSPEQFPHFHHHQQLCCTQNADSSETVKNLLMLVNSQNEQIKCLQMQVDRLLKLHEETLKEKQKCTCCIDTSHCGNVYSQSQSNDCAGDPVNKESALNGLQKRMLKGQENEEAVTNLNYQHLRNERTQEDKRKQSILEQKVSIGVMTSFEFTVQNNPFRTESNEVQQEDEREDMSNKTARCMYKDPTDVPWKKQNIISMKPSGLENIIEDSESHLSSSQQRSSNLNNTTNSARQSPVERNRNEIGHKELPDGNDSHLRAYGNGKNITIPESPIPTMNSHSNQKKVFHKRHNGSSYDKNSRSEGLKRGEVHAGNGSRTRDSAISNTYETNVEDHRRNNIVEESIVLNSDDMKIDESPPSPEPSIHVDMQEYSSDDSSSPPKRTPNVGWTFYNNVLGQVNQILQNSPVADDSEKAKTKPKQSPRRKIFEGKMPVDRVKAATLNQLAKMGISLMDNNECNPTTNKKINFDASYYPRVDTEVAQGTSMMTETNTSMRMKALAMKYLNEDQLSEQPVRKQRTEAVQQVMVSNVDGTNLSFATLRYLQRYQLLPENVNYPEEADKENVQMLRNGKEKPILRNGMSHSQTPRNWPNKILDSTTMKEQPKLL